MLVAPRLGLVAFIIGFFSVSSVYGLRTVKRDLPGLLERTAFIFTGEVEAVDFAAGERTPRTRVTFKVIDLVAGPTIPPIFDVELPMGLMSDGTVLDIAEAPRFMPGETYLVLYKRGTWNVTPVVGFDQGHYREVVSPHGPVYVSAGGRCVTTVSEKGFLLGPRVVPRQGYPAFGDHPSEAHDPLAAKLCMPATEVLSALAEKVAAFGELDGAVYDTVPASDILFHRLMGRPSTVPTKKSTAL